MTLDKNWELKREFAFETLGPIFAEYFRRLWLYHQAFGSRFATALFCARGGLRIRYLYNQFLNSIGLHDPVPSHDFMVSRLLSSKVCFNRKKDLVIANLSREFCSSTLLQVTLALLPMHGDVSRLLNDADRAHLEATHATAEAISLLLSSGIIGKLWREHSCEQEALFKEYLDGIVKGNHIILLHDTGLFGSSQMMLQESYPEYEWVGLYFGRSNYRGDSAPHFSSAIGIMFEHDSISYILEETCFLRYWHLIEAPLEPDFPSVGYLTKSQDGIISSNLGTNDLESRVSCRKNPFFAGISEYIANLASDHFHSIRLQHRSAIKRLAKKIHAPNPKDVYSLEVGCRSHDFGRPGSVPVLSSQRNIRVRNKLLAIRSALWPEGQMVRELGYLGSLLLKGLLWGHRIREAVQIIYLHFLRLHW